MIFQGDCLNVMKKIPSNCIDLVVTSPPYADARGGIKPEEYVKWFGPIANEIKRVLKLRGTFILNIKEKVVDGERHTYVLDLIKGMKEHDWYWTEEFVWHKKSCAPGKWPNRFRDAWERCLQFNKHKHFYMNQRNVMVPIGDWAKSRLKNLSETDKVRDESKVGSGFGKNVSNWKDRELVYPSNVLYLAAETGNKNHHSAFPLSLPTWFIKCFSKENDWVMDPFMGSGTTCLAAKRLGRRYIGIEIKEGFYKIAKERLNNEN